MNDLDRNERSDEIASEAGLDERSEFENRMDTPTRTSSSAKPVYSEATLNRIDLLTLRDRKDGIDNPLAREIAGHIWDEYWSILSKKMINSIGGLRTRKKEEKVLQENRRMDKLSAGREDRVLQLLSRLNKSRLGQIAIEPGDTVKQVLQGANPLFRQFINSSPPSNAKEMAQFLIDNFELYLQPPARVPWSITYGMVNSLLAISTLTWWAYMFSIVNISTDLTLNILLPVIGLCLIFDFVSTNVQFNRLLALYISFTDEFMDYERQKDDPVIEKAGS